MSRGVKAPRGAARIIKAASAYFGIVLGLGFFLGAIRMVFVIPRIGETSALLLELPIILALSWFAARWCVMKLPIGPDAIECLAM